MFCQDIGKCKDLSYCADEGAVLHIGEASDTMADMDALWVTFTDLSTGRVTSLEADITGSAVDVTMGGFSPIPGHVYQVALSVNVYGGGIYPVVVKPYVHAPASGFSVGSTEYDALLVRFVKNHDTGGISSYSEQWMSL